MPQRPPLPSDSTDDLHRQVSEPEPGHRTDPVGLSLLDRWTHCNPFLSEDARVQGERVRTPEVTGGRPSDKVLQDTERLRDRTEKFETENPRLRQEMSERKQAQDALEEIGQRQRLLLESTNVVPWEAKARRQFTYVGPQAVKLLGFPVESWYEEDFWVEQIHPEDRRSTLQSCRESSARYKNYEIEYRMYRKDGACVWLRDFVAVVSKGGEVTGLRGFMIDITRDKQAAEERRLSEERYQDLYDNAPDMFCSTETATGIMQQCNETLAKKTGYTKDEIIGQHFLFLCHPDALEYTKKLFRGFKDTDRLRDIQLELRRKDGSKIIVSSNASSIRDPDGTLRSRAIFRDITARKRAEEALRSSEAALRTSQTELRHLTGKLLSAQEEERRRLARELHDDLTQRLAVLAIEMGELEQELHPSTRPSSEKLRRIKLEVVKLSTDVHRMAYQLHPSILDDLGLQDAIEAECNRVSERESLAITFVCETLPEVLPKDVALCLYRITQESLHNIAKHSRAPKAAVRLRAENNVVLLSIHDSGVGFELTKAKEKSGMGLASMGERVRLIQGTLSIDSKPGQGTTIQVRAPLARVHKDAETTRTAGG